MSAHTADTNASFQLPNMSYIDAKWEEPELRKSARGAAQTHGGFAARLAARLTGLRALFRQNDQAAELFMMSDRELHDIGLTRSDLDRVFDPAYNSDLRERGVR